MIIVCSFRAFLADSADHLRLLSMSRAVIRNIGRDGVEDAKGVSNRQDCEEKELVGRTGMSEGKSHLLIGAMGVVH